MTASLDILKIPVHLLILLFTQQSSPQFFDTVDAGQSSGPFLCDIDNDGKLDLIVGNSNGKLYYYKNNGTASNYSFTLVSNSFQGIFVGNDSAPCLKDMDGDGDLDMLIGNRARENILLQE